MLETEIKFIHKTHPRAKSIKIKIERDGSVTVVRPRFTPKLMADLFAKRSLPWIHKHLASVKKNLNKMNEVSIFGKKYEILSEIQEKLARPIIKNEKLILSFLEKPKDHEFKKTLDQFLKSTAKKYIVPRTHKIAEIMKIDFKNISFKQQKTLWGSCSSKGNLNFNWRLIHSPVKVIDYVIIHELAHRTHMNHSREFWNLVEKFDPEYKKHRKYLKHEYTNTGIHES